MKEGRLKMSIALTADNSSEEPWRIERLQELVGKYTEVLKMMFSSSDPSQFGLIDLHDQNNLLIATWDSQMNLTLYSAYITIPWTRDYKLNVEHKVQS